VHQPIGQVQRKVVGVSAKKSLTGKCGGGRKGAFTGTLCISARGRDLRK